MLDKQKEEKKVSLTIDGHAISGTSGQTVMQAADDAGIYIPRLCDVEGLRHQGSCRICTVKFNGRTVAACTQPIMADAVIEHETQELNFYRQQLVHLLLHEGNHLCPICEASGNCELQAMAYRLGLSQSNNYPYLQPVRTLDASHSDIALDTNRCIRCGRCIRASQDIDGKGVFGYTGRGINKRLGVNAENLRDTDLSIDDQAVAVETCPVGCIIRKRTGFHTPIGEREFDQKLIGATIETARDE